VFKLPKESVKESSTAMQDPLISWRRAKVAEYVAKGYSQVEIAKILQVSEPTISRDVEQLRQEALNGLSSYIESLPFQWFKALTGIDILLRKAWEILDSKGLESDQQVDVIKTIANLTQTRLSMYAEPEAMKRAANDRLKFKEELDRMKRAGGKWRFENAYDVKGEKVRKWKRREKDDIIEVVV
jgi:hypothetical protein